MMKASLYFFCAVDILEILKLTFFSSIRKLKSVWIRTRVLEEIQFLFVFNILRHSSGKVLRRLKSKKGAQWFLVRLELFPCVVYISYRPTLGP